MASMIEKVKVNEFRRELGIAVKRRRNRLHLSQEKFADKADIHRTYVSSIELGKVDVGIGTIHKVAHALNLSLSKLIKEAEKNI